MEKNSWTDRVRNEEVFQKVKDRNILHEISKRKANWICHILRRNCLLKRAIEGNIKGSIDITGKRRRRSKQLLENLKETRGYWKLQEEELDCPLSRTRFGKVYRPVVRQTTERTNE
jgi:hypothetical protein